MGFQYGRRKKNKKLCRVLDVVGCWTGLDWTPLWMPGFHSAGGLNEARCSESAVSERKKPRNRLAPITLMQPDLVHATDRETESSLFETVIYYL